MFKKWLNKIKCCLVGHKPVHSEKQTGVFASSYNISGQLGTETDFKPPKLFYLTFDYKIKTCKRCGYFLGWYFDEDK